MRPRALRRNGRRLPYVALAGIAFLAALYCLSGIVMAGSFANGVAEVDAHWERVARRFALAMVGCLAVSVASGVLVWRRSRAMGDFAPRE